MTRYILAGLAMTASVVLLFLASFRAPIPTSAGRAVGQGGPIAAQVAGTEAPPSATGSQAIPALNSRDPAEAVQALQEQIRQASQTLASLENRVTQTRQDLASLQTQKGVGAQPLRPGQGPLSSQPMPGAPPSQPGLGTPPSLSDRGALSTRTEQAAPPASPVRGAVDATPAARPTEAAEKPARRTTGSAGQTPAANTQGGSEAGTAPIPLPGVVQRPRPVELRPAEVRTAEAAPLDARASRPNTSVDSSAGDDDAAQITLNRLRRQSAQAAPSQVRPDNPGEPHRVPTTERLADARAAVIEGRLEDARRFLQAAQVQLVFRAVGPGGDQPRVSQATGPISQALLALSTGDRGRAIIAIDQAAGALDPNAQARQFGSLPPLDGTLLPPVPRNGP